MEPGETGAEARGISLTWFRSKLLFFLELKISKLDIILVSNIEMHVNPNQLMTY